MIDLTQHPALLRLLSYFYRAGVFLHSRNSATREMLHARTAFYEELWREAADDLGASCNPLGYGMYEIELAGRRVCVCRNLSPIDDQITLEIAGNKPLVYKLLSKQGLRTPRYAEFELADVERAARFMEQAAADCVVKPARDTGGGNGVTAGVRTRRALALAAAAAAAWGNELLIEEQLAGDTYRLLYLDGILLDAVVRKHPTVVADGESTVLELVELANEARLAHGAKLGQVLLSVDLDMRNTLAKQGLSLSSVPAAGTVVRLKTVANENSSVENESAAHLLCGSIIDDGATAATAVGARLAGVDVLTTDPIVPLQASGGAIIEVNTTPGYYYHYHKPGGPFPVAVHVLARILGVPETSGLWPTELELTTVSSQI